MARRHRVKPTKLEKRELKQIWRDYLALGMPVEEVERKVAAYQKFLLENRSNRE